MRVNQNRSVFTYILLSIVTCGLYSLYFIYALAKDVNIMCSADGKHTSGLLALIILTFLTCGIYGIYWEYCVAERIGNAQARLGQPKDIDGVKFLLFSLIGAVTACGLISLYGMHLLCEGSNKVARSFNGN